MLKEMIQEQPKIHSRNICLTTYPHTNSQMLVQGTLEDRRYIPVFDITGKAQPPGTIHHLSVILLIAPGP
jgi:hypothetical protein